jgi:Flavodoxin domain
MRHSVLVAHAAKDGSARRAGEAVAARLAALGLDVEVRPSASVEELARYEAVVVGGPVRFGRWHHDARAFLSRHRGALARIPVAVFATETVRGHDGELELALVDVPELEPVATGRFAAPSQRLPFASGGTPAADDIERWATELAHELGVERSAWEGTAQSSTSPSRIA